MAAFPEREMTREDYRLQSMRELKLEEPVTVDGEMPELKESITCMKHGVVDKTYNPRWDKPSDAIRGLPCVRHTIVSVCKHCVEERMTELHESYLAERKAAFDASMEEIMLQKIERFGVSLRNISHRIETVSPVNAQQEKAIDACRSIYRDVSESGKSGNLILCGSVGTGKTLVCSALVNSLIRAGKRAEIITVASMMRALKDTWRKDCQHTEQQVIDSFVSASLLVIDEVGVQFGSDTEKLFLFEIIDGRYNKMRPTILISNLDIGGIRDIVGDRCLNRLKEDGGKVIAFDYESQRGLKRA